MWIREKHHEDALSTPQYLWPISTRIVVLQQPSIPRSCFISSPHCRICSHPGFLILGKLRPVYSQQRQFPVRRLHCLKGPHAEINKSSRRLSPYRRPYPPRQIPRIRQPTHKIAKPLVNQPILQRLLHNFVFVEAQLPYHEIFRRLGHDRISVNISVIRCDRSPGLKKPCQVHQGRFRRPHQKGQRDNTPRLEPFLKRVHYKFLALRHRVQNPLLIPSFLNLPKPLCLLHGVPRNGSRLCQLPSICQLRNKIRRVLDPIRIVAQPIH